MMKLNSCGADNNEAHKLALIAVDGTQVMRLEEPE